MMNVQQYKMNFQFRIYSPPFGATRWFNTSTMAGELDEVGRDEGFSPEVVDMNNVQAQLLGRGIPAILGLAYLKK